MVKYFNLEEKNKINPLFLKHNRVLNNWQSFYFMSVPNVRYVMRSASLLKYGPKFEYTEGMSNTFLISALFVNFGWMVLGSLLLLSPFRWMLKKLIPQGAGPKQGEIEKGYFKMKSIGTSNGENVIVDIVGISDPGYGETCKMIAESALCIVKDMDRLNDGKASNGVFPQYSGGVLTSASAFGFVLVDRLNAAGMTFALNSNVHKNE